MVIRAEDLKNFSEAELEALLRQSYQLDLDMEEKAYRKELEEYEKSLKILQEKYPFIVKNDCHFAFRGIDLLNYSYISVKYTVSFFSVYDSCPVYIIVISCLHDLISLAEYSVSEFILPLGFIMGI